MFLSQVCWIFFFENFVFNLFEIIILLVICLVIAIAFIIKQRLLVKRLHNKLLELMIRYYYMFGHFDDLMDL